ncbi:hypothetical protein C8R43DRAFT_947096 [Mycena crocata]|nr:hypothetical protein C8R43DRAFT_947096 [Mycena crocata]
MLQLLSGAWLSARAALTRRIDPEPKLGLKVSVSEHIQGPGEQPPLELNAEVFAGPGFNSKHRDRIVQRGVDPRGSKPSEIGKPYQCSLFEERGTVSSSTASRSKLSIPYANPYATHRPPSSSGTLERAYRTRTWASVSPIQAH